MTDFIIYDDVIQLTDHIGIKKTDVKGLKHTHGESYVIITVADTHRNIKDQFVAAAIKKGVTILSDE